MNMDMIIEEPRIRVAPSSRQAHDLVMRYGQQATAYQILNPGIEHWFSREGDAVIGYVTSAGIRVVAGGPICAPERLQETIAAFEADAHRQHQSVCYLGAETQLTEALAHRGPRDRFLLGAQPVWNPHTWPDVLARKSSLRAQVNRARNKGLTIANWSPERASAHPDLQRCLREWLQTRTLPPLRFLVEPHTLTPAHERKFFVAEQHEQIRGFLVATPIPLRNGWLIEQIVRGKGAPNGTTELLLDTAMRHVADAGATYVTLGVSPLSQRADIPAAQQARWIRLLLAWVRVHGRRFYNFEGLDAFKAKFLPDAWEPVYAITSEPTVSLRTLYAIVGAFSGMEPIPFVLQGLSQAFGSEVQWMAQSIRHALGNVRWIEQA